MEYNARVVYECIILHVASPQLCCIYIFPNRLQYVEYITLAVALIYVIGVLQCSIQLQLI